MELSPTIQAGIKKGIIELSEDGSRINYIYLNKTDNFDNAFNKVLAETYISLIETYNYPIQRIDIYVKVKNKTKRDEYDIVVYDDDSKLQPIIIVECKGNTDVQLRKAFERLLVFKNVFWGTNKFVFLTNGLKNEFYRIDSNHHTFELISSIPFFGKDIPLFRYVKGGRLQDDNVDNNPIKQQYFDLELISESNLQQIFNLICEELGKEGVFNVVDELNKLLLCKIVDERKSRKNGEPYDFQIVDISSSGDTDREKKINLALYKRVLALYDEGRRFEHELFDDDIRLTPKCVRIVVDYLQGVNLTQMDLDSIDRASASILPYLFKADFGQMITPRTIVKFVVDSLPLFRDCKIIDTSCGSGGYLIYALDKLRKQDISCIETNLFGFEIDSQIARMAKFNMLLRDMNSINVICINGLFDADIVARTTKNPTIQYGIFDFAITTPPLIVKENIAFIEQNYKFLRDGGLLSIIVPNGLLINSSLQYFRNKIMTCFRIVAIISLPPNSFKSTTAIKCSVLFLQKMPDQQQDYPIFMSVISNNDYDFVSDELRQFIKSILTNTSYNYTGKTSNIILVNKNNLAQNWNPIYYKNRTTNKSEVKLSEIAIINPSTILPQLHSDEVISYVASDRFITEDGTLKIDSVRPIAESKGFRLFKNGDILFSRFNGNLATIHEAKNGFGFCNLDYFVIRPKNESLLSVDYLSIMLKDERVLQTTKIWGSHFVSKSILENIMIPLPPLDGYRLLKIFWKK